MFRAQPNPFDDVVAKATDENLTSENWEYIMDVCDKVTGEDSGAKDAVASMIKRLAHRNANVQLYTLELANALSQNCGPKMHRELASRAFTDALLRLANDRNSHQQVKAKILERMQEWAEMFNDPDLGIMKDQYNRLKSMNPNLHPPSAPSKSRLTDLDRQKEEDELQMALKLSIQEKNVTQTKQPQSNGGKAANGQEQKQQGGQNQPVPSGTTAATVSRVRALFDFQATDTDELTFRKGDIIAVLESVYKDWWKGLLRGQTGIFPLNYVEKLADPTPEELERESHMEAEVFAEIKNVEKLLTLLSTSTSELNVRDNEEITKLYHSTLAIRPKLIELIGKYSQRKDDFTQLNERFIKSCRDYEALLDASMTQAAQPPYQYGRPAGHSYGGYPQGPPPQQDPQRYYTPGLQQEHQRPQQPSSPPLTNQRPASNAPFYLAGHSGPSTMPADRQSYPPAAIPNPRIPPSSSMQPDPTHTYTPPPPQPQATLQTGHGPQSTYSNPQELATSAYDSPVNTHNQGVPYGPDDYPAPLAPNGPAYASSGPTTGHGGGQAQYKTFTPYSQVPPQSQPSHNQYSQQPSYDPPQPPNQAPTPLSNLSATQDVDGRATLPSMNAGFGSAPGYKPYQRPGSGHGTATSTVAAADGGPGGAGGDPGDYYRTGASY